MNCGLYELLRGKRNTLNAILIERTRFVHLPIDCRNDIVHDRRNDLGLISEVIVNVPFDTSASAAISFADAALTPRSAMTRTAASRQTRAGARTLWLAACGISKMTRPHVILARISERHSPFDRFSA